MTDTSHPERRRFSRVQFDHPVHLRWADHEADSTLLDISLKGALLQCPEHWQPALGEPLELRIMLDAEGSMAVQMEGEISHLLEGALGVRCRRIDLDSMARLRRLIEVNLGEPALLERELSAMLDSVQR